MIRHIAWDIGAENVALRLSEQLEAPLILANYSRLLIDLNRPPRCATSIPKISETTAIPGNIDLPDEEVQYRIDNLFWPFQDRLTELVNARIATGKPTIIIGVHSFTPVYKNVARPWHAGILFRRSQSFGAKLTRVLGGAAAKIAENEPYRIDDESDYTVPVHGEARGLDAVLVELRQDLIADDKGAAEWAGRLSRALTDRCFDEFGATSRPAPSG